MTACGVYVHVPFCRRKCSYCGFYSVPIADDCELRAACAAFTERIVDEIEQRLAGVRTPLCVDTIYFGGGTPSLLDPQEVHRVLLAVRRVMDVSDGAEITLEMRPDDCAPASLDAYRDVGVNRVVLGVQTLSEAMHREIGRAGTLCSGEHLDIFFEAKGIIRCVDFIIGMPGETEEVLMRDIDSIAGRRPAHVSFYLLSIEPGTPLAARSAFFPEDEESQARLLELTMDCLSEHGYHHYEISNYSLPGFESRHNMKYWTFNPYLGFGPGAHSFFGGERFFNNMTVWDYLSSNEVRLERDPRTRVSAAAEYLMTGLRLTAGVSLRQMEARLSFDIPHEVRVRIGHAVKAGLLEWDKEADVIRLTRAGILVSNRVIYDIVEPLL